MGFRFSRRIALMPGLRLNVGTRGASLSVGPRGASVTLGGDGVHGNIGIPGTGLSYRTRLDPPAGRPRRSTADLPRRIVTRLDGDKVVFLDEEGKSLDPSLIAAARSAMKDELHGFLEECAATRNIGLEELGLLHRDIPASVSNAVAPSGKPERSAYPSQQAYMQALMTWRAGCANAGPDADAIETALLDRLGALSWPRETNIALVVRGGRVLLDVDLPELEEMPSVCWATDHARLMLVAKLLSATDIARLYLAHVCAVVCRLVGHSFAIGSFIESVAVSGFTQRKSASGHVSIDYVVVADVARAQWAVMASARREQRAAEAVLRELNAKFQADARGILSTQQPLGQG